MSNWSLLTWTLAGLGIMAGMFAFTYFVGLVIL